MADLSPGAGINREQKLERDPSNRTASAPDFFAAFSRADVRRLPNDRTVPRTKSAPRPRRRSPSDGGPPPRRTAAPRRRVEPNSRAAARRYAIRLVDDQILPAGLRLEWSRRAEWDDWSRHSEGCNVLRTNVRDWSSEALWRTYIHLSEAEAAFRINKSELSIRPIWHQREDRVLAHILVCFLATCCGRRWSNGRAAPVSAIVRAPFSRNSPPSPAPMSSCRRRRLPAANCDCAASCAPIAPKRSCCSASVSASQQLRMPRATRTM